MKKGTLIIAVLILCATAFMLGRCCRSAAVIPASDCEVVDSITTEDTVADLTPTLRDSVVVRYEYKTIPITPPSEVGDTASLFTPPSDEIAIVEHGDSAEVIIPITQKVYETDDYRAYVSGYKATMDSIFITRQTTTIHIREPTKTKRFNVGVQAGYGLTPKGFQPYIGVGISATLFSF